MLLESVEPTQRRLPLLAHPGVVWGGAAVAGSCAATSFVPAFLVALGWVLLAVLCATPSRRWPVALALLAFTLTWWRAERSLEGFEFARVQARDALGVPQRCAATVEVTTSPTLRSLTVVSPTETLACARAEGPEMDLPGSRTVLFRGIARGLSCEHGELGGEWLLALSGEDENLARGDRIEVVTGLAPVQFFRNAGLSDPTPAAARRGAVLSGTAWGGQVVERGLGLGARVDRARAFVRRRIEATYPAAVVPLARALVLGESDLPESDALAFSQSGLMHLLAVSGTHLVIAVLALVKGLRSLLVRVGPLSRRYDVPRLAAALGALLSLLYADFAGGSGSAFRAAYMLCAVLGARTLGFRVSGSGALGLSLCTGALLDPLVGADISFQLSALATAGLIGIGQPVGRWLDAQGLSRGLWGKLLESLVATLSSTLPCSPVLAALDGQMTAAALAANVIAGPFGELLALPACLLHACASSVPALERGLALIGGGALYAVRGIALLSASVEQARFQVPLPSAWDAAWVVLLALALSWLGRGHAAPRWSWRGWLVACCLAAFTLMGVAWATQEEEAPRLGVTALDVGQGDGLALDLPLGQLGFVDGGGFPGGVPDTAERVLVPLLRSRGKRALDLVVLSHAHPDHLLGLATLARTTRIRELWHPSGAAELSGPYRELVEAVRATGGRVLGPAELCGQPLVRGGARFEVLAPCPGPEGWGANDESLVVRVGLGQQQALLTGDVERNGEARLVRRHPLELGAAWLKVPHHGSHTSSSAEFLQRVKPRWAVVSSGVRNRFDHPRQGTLDRLREHGIGVLRTDRSGSISFVTDGVRAELFAFSLPR